MLGFILYSAGAGVNISCVSCKTVAFYVQIGPYFATRIGTEATKTEELLIQLHSRIPTTKYVEHVSSVVNRVGPVRVLSMHQF